MYEYFFGDYSLLNVIVLAFSAVLIGINKTGLPGIGLVPVLLLVSIFPARESTGLQLMLICMGDVMAVSYYRRHADWKIIFRLLPWSLTGIGIGCIIMQFISDQALRPILVTILLFLVVLGCFTRKMKQVEVLSQHKLFSVGFGIFAGITTQVANAAGPIMALYFLAMRLDKVKYVGSGAWLFLILNWIKLPIFFCEGRVTTSSIKADLAMIPFLLFGGFLGVILLKKISQNSFERIIEILIVLGALYMLIPKEWIWQT